MVGEIPPRGVLVRKRDGVLTRNLRGAEVRHDLDSNELMSSRRKSYASCRHLGLDDLPVFVGLGNQYSHPLVRILLDKFSDILEGFCAGQESDTAQHEGL